MKAPIYVTKADFKKLTEIMEGMSVADSRSHKWLSILESELDRAMILEDDEIPPTAVTLHSQVRLRDLDSDECTAYRLTLPSEANAGGGNLSVLAPLGIAVLGYREGDSFECETPGGVRRFRVESVLFQPEAARLAMATR